MEDGEMSEIVERLRKYGTGSPDALLLMRAAADTIEKLEAEVERLRENAVQRIIDTPDDEFIARAVADFGSAEEAMKVADHTEGLMWKVRAEAAEQSLAAIQKESDRRWGLYLEAAHTGQVASEERDNAHAEIATLQRDYESLRGAATLLVDEMGLSLPDTYGDLNLENIWDAVGKLNFALSKPVPAVDAGPGDVMAFAQAILHGDEVHRAWLIEVAEAFEAGKPLPKPRSSGSAGAVAALEREIFEAAVDHVSTVNVVDWEPDENSPWARLLAAVNRWKDSPAVDVGNYLRDHGDDTAEAVVAAAVEFERQVSGPGWEEAARILCTAVRDHIGKGG